MNKELSIIPALFDGTGTCVIATYCSPGTPTVFDDFTLFFIAHTNTDLDAQVAAINAKIATYTALKGYTVTKTITYIPGSASATAQGLLSPADYTKLHSLSAGSFKSYQALISQSGTSAPSSSTLVNDFGATTFTWARTGTGVYTLTANAAVFTANKTGVLITDPSNALWAFRPVVTSTTVITISTSVLAVLAVVLGATNTDALLSNNLIEVRVFA